MGYGGHHENVDADLRARGIGSSAEAGGLPHADHPSQGSAWLDEIIIPAPDIGISDEDILTQLRRRGVL